MPAGLSINTTSGQISGTPTAVSATANYTVTATNAYGSTTTIISITVNNNPPSNLSYAGSPFTFTIGAAITTVNPTVTGTATSYSVSSTLPTGLTFDTTTGQISGTPTVATVATSYTVTATNAYGSTTTTISITVNDPVFSLVYEGDPYIFLKNTAIATVTPVVTGGPVTSCSISPTPALPAGLSFNTATCEITGTPTTTKNSTNYTITASDGTNSVNVVINITVSTFKYTATSFTFVKDLAIPAVTPVASGSITSCTSSPALPAGLSVNNTTCEITGIPTTAQGATSYTISAVIGTTYNTNINITIVNTAYKIFVTNTAYSGDLKTEGSGGDGIAGADNLCQTEAGALALSGTYKALLVDGVNRQACSNNNCSPIGTRINWILKPSTVYIRYSDFARIFTTNTNAIFSFGTMSNAFFYGTRRYWTGFRTTTVWNTGTNTCSNWTSSSSSFSGVTGISSSKKYQKALVDASITATCDISRYLICVEQ